MQIGAVKAMFHLKEYRNFSPYLPFSSSCLCEIRYKGSASHNAVEHLVSFAKIDAGKAVLFLPA
jgi:hypothetical protein